MNLCLNTTAFLISTFAFLLPAKNFATNETEKIYTPAHVAAAFVSDWETVADWSTTRKDNQVAFYYNRNCPELNNTALKGGSVVVFAKGYDFEGFSKSAEKPLTLPFYMMSASENSTGAYNWYWQQDQEKVEVGLKMTNDLEQSFLKNSNNIRFRYFFLSSQFLKKNNLDDKALKQLSYQQLATLTGVPAS